ncbi:hypothetical protein [Microseira sp. BLCC-F43]|jgi:hypothetical protein|uniref:hypothetical protein n=1 Tax=Microseira sp. BLCC-F43 TaxID=3153602 RepID=UPI0035BAF21A
MKSVTKVALIALLWISVINTGKFYSIDNYLRMKMAHAWWTGTEEVSPGYQAKSRDDVSAGVMGVGNKRYIAYDVGQSMLMLPGDWLGTQLHRWFPKIEVQDFRVLAISFLIFVPLNIAAVVSCFWLLRLFEFEERIAGLTSIIWLLGTTVLHYAQEPFQNNQLLLFVTIGYAAALAYAKHQRPSFAALSGLALGAALLIRMTSIIHVLTVFLFLVGCIAYQSRDRVKVLKTVGLWIVGFIPLALIGRVFDYIRYGSFWTTGQSLATKQLHTNSMFSGLPDLPDNYPFTNPPYVGIFGVLFSPAKSIFIYDPLLLPCLVLGILLWKRLSPYIQWYLICGIFNLGLHVVLTSRMDYWHGDWGWGARYHVTSVHLLLIPLAGLFIQQIKSARQLGALLMRGVLILAIMVQMASVTMPFNLEVTQDTIGVSKSRGFTLAYHSRLGFRLGQRFTNIVCLINSSFSNNCPVIVAEQLSPAQKSLFLNRHNRIAFLPFDYVRYTFNRKWAFIVWGAVLTLAIGTTLWFCFLAQGKTSSFIH